MAELNAAQRLYAMSFSKSKAEDIVTGLSIPMWEHLGKVFSAKDDPEIINDWRDEIRNNYLLRMSSTVNNIKSKTGKVSYSELVRWILGTSRSFEHGAAMFITAKEYRKVGKRFKTEEGAVSATESIDLLPLAELIASELLRADHFLVLKSSVGKIVDSVLKEAEKF